MEKLESAQRMHGRRALQHVHRWEILPSKVAVNQMDRAKQFYLFVDLFKVANGRCVTILKQMGMLIPAVISSVAKKVMASVVRACLLVV